MYYIKQFICFVHLFSQNLRTYMYAWLTNTRKYLRIDIIHTYSRTDASFNDSLRISGNNIIIINPPPLQKRILLICSLYRTTGSYVYKCM